MSRLHGILGVYFERTWDHNLFPILSTLCVLLFLKELNEDPRRRVGLMWSLFFIGHL